MQVGGQAAPPYPTAWKTKPEVPLLVPSTSQGFGVAVIALVMATAHLSQLSLLRTVLLGHGSSCHTVPKAEMCLLPHPQPLADPARRGFYLGWLASAQQPEGFTWFKHFPGSGL